MAKWLVSQIGSREKYAIPRALAIANELEQLYTDIWVQPSNLFSILVSKLRSRYHEGLIENSVRSNVLIHLAKNAYESNGRRVRDNLFDSWVAESILKTTADTFFGYSYASIRSAENAKKMGMRVILGQINPGPAEAEIVRKEFESFEGGKFKPTIPSEAYWRTWRAEVEMSDILMVNSEWSRMSLVNSGVNSEKIKIIPLAYERKGNYQIKEKYFGNDRKLSVLFLGSVSIRKGFHKLVNAMTKLSKAPVELHVVGRLNGPEMLVQNLPSNIIYHGAVNPHDVDNYFREADVFVLPTLSDGFGLTLLEAQYHKTPVICTPYCGDVINHNINGFVTKNAEEESLLEAIEFILNNPECIEKWSNQSDDLTNFSIENISKQLLQL